MITYPNCKINLGLHVVGKRPDGYHDLETIFVPVHDLSDTLEIVESDNLQMVQEGIVLDNAPEDNLCTKAWRLLHEEFDIPTVSIRLQKGIPFGAGLGGGSSDAAFTLKMLNEMFALRLTDSQLEQRAARLGRGACVDKRSLRRTETRPFRHGASQPTGGREATH